jgi:hypothetical protein
MLTKSGVGVEKVTAMGTWNGAVIKESNLR